MMPTFPSPWTEQPQEEPSFDKEAFFEQRKDRLNFVKYLVFSSALSEYEDSDECCSCGGQVVDDATVLVKQNGDIYCRNCMA